MNPNRNKKNLETTISEITNFAYSYLEKYSPSRQLLRTHLLKKILNKQLKLKDKKQITALIDVVIDNLEKREMISDKHYSNSKTKSFLKRGYSLNKIRYSLIKKGISKQFIEGSISKIKNEQADPDFFSALKICTKRRIGPIRPEDNRPLFYKKDLSFLARSGFTYETSKKVLELSKDAYIKFYKMI